MALTITQEPQISQLDALWTLFQAQTKSVRKAFTQRILEQVALANKKPRQKSSDDDIKAIDNQLYGSIKLPADFDYAAELEQTLNAKYSI